MINWTTLKHVLVSSAAAGVVSTLGSLEAVNWSTVGLHEPAPEIITFVLAYLIQRVKLAEGSTS